MEVDSEFPHWLNIRLVNVLPSTNWPDRYTPRGSPVNPLPNCEMSPPQQRQLFDHQKILPTPAPNRPQITFRPPLPRHTHTPSRLPAILCPFEHNQQLEQTACLHPSQSIDYSNLLSQSLTAIAYLSPPSHCLPLRLHPYNPIITWVVQ